MSSSNWFASIDILAKTYATKVAKGVMPKCCREFLEDHPEIPRSILVCETHGRWFNQIDPMAPYHWELCRCSKCP